MQEREQRSSRAGGWYHARRQGAREIGCTGRDASRGVEGRKLLFDVDVVVAVLVLVRMIGDTATAGGRGCTPLPGVRTPGRNSDESAGALAPFLAGRRGPGVRRSRLIRGSALGSTVVAGSGIRG